MCAAKLKFCGCYLPCMINDSRLQTHMHYCVFRERSHGEGEILKVSSGAMSGSDLWPFTSPQSYDTKLSLVTEVNIRSSTNTLTHTLPVALQLQSNGKLYWYTYLLVCSCMEQWDCFCHFKLPVSETPPHISTVVIVMQGMASKDFSHVDL